MQHSLSLPNRPYSAIQKGTKKVEGRVPLQIPNKYQNMQKGDLIIITNEDTSEQMKVEINYVHHYPDTRTMLQREGVANVLSSGGTIEQGIESYNSFTGYKENIPKYGIYAIGIKPIK